MTQLFEAIMIVCFGISWPISIMKSLKARTSKGKSLVFLCFILVGYTAGIIGKLITANITYVFIFYCINWLMVATDLVLYFRNRKLDNARG